jgi:hypothetical protein
VLLLGELPLVSLLAADGTIDEERFAAVTRAVADDGGTTFSAVVPEASFRAGSNRVEIFLLGSSPGRPPLVRLGGAGAGAPELELVRRSGGEAIRLSDGRFAAIEPRSLRGWVDTAVAGPHALELSGWAADVERGRLVDAVAVFVDGRAVHVGATVEDRPELDLTTGSTVHRSAGFRFEIPVAVVGAKGESDVRVFALSGAIASELSYHTGWEWRR